MDDIFSLSFKAAFNYVLDREVDKDNRDEVTHHPHDLGGMTKYGISLRLLTAIESLDDSALKRYGIFTEVSEDTIKELTLNQAKAIYHDEFWSHAPFEKINVDMVRNYLFDMAVNMGIAPMVKCVQRACWACGYHREFSDDGIMGNTTVSMINRAGTALVCPLKAERANYYRMIVERNPAQSVFLDGWLNRTYG